MDHSQADERVKSSYHKIIFLRTLSRSFTFDLCDIGKSALQCYCGDGRYKIQTSIKILVSKNAATWRLHQTCW